MTQQTIQSAVRPVLNSIAPQLFVASIQASCDFYKDKLGFQIDFIYGGPPFYGQVSRDSAHLALRHVDEPVFIGDIRSREHYLSAAITVATAEEINQLYLDFESTEVPFAQPLHKEPWGAQNFIIQDPDGNLILFAGPAD